ncbi:MAG TPA: alpha/beta hydrolase [Flavobacteriaceae bacterium]|nr:alpha/beta hydrolase [Flavobacteriaceae bacterium]
MFRKNGFFYGICSLILFLGSCSSDDVSTKPTTPEKLPAETFMNVSYGNDPQQVYDIYLPENRSSETTKVLILIHGGGWTGGDKSEMTGFIDDLQKKHPSLAIVNMNYVLATTSIPAFPDQFLDVDRVIEQLTSQKEELQILPEFGLIGVSAGAHISLMYDYVYDTDDQVKMVCDIVGPTNFTDPFYAENPDFELALSLLVDESAYPTGTDYAAILSPALQVSTASSPSILFYGNQDPLVPLTNGQLLNSQLNEADVPHDFTVYEGGHGNWSATSYEDLTVKLNAFITAHLGN